MAPSGIALQRARLQLLYLAFLLPCGFGLEPMRLEPALGVQSFERRKLGGTEVLLAYTDAICGGYPQQLANPFTAPTIEDVIFGGIRDFTALGSVKGIDLAFTDAYVDKTSQTYYPRGVYELALYYNDYPSPPGARFALLNRVAGRRNALTTLPTTAAKLDTSQLGKFNDKGPGSLQSATVCCSDDNMFESMRAVRQIIGDTKIGLPVCTGYPVEVKRPAAFPLWAGVRLTVQQPIGSMEYVIASIQFIWASDTPTPVALPPPSPPSSPVAVPAVNPPFLPKGASPDWLAIATGVVSFQLVEPTVSIIMTKRSFPIANSDIDQTVIAATRVNRGAAVALASENMLQHCCGGALGASATQLNQTAKGLDLLVLQGALWAAWYWVKTGAVRVRVSHERYLPLARWLSAQRPGLFLTPAEQDMPSYVTSPDLFIRNIKGTVGQGKRPPEHLYIVGPEDPAYTDPAMANAMRDYLNAAGGVMFLGPNPTAVRADTGGSDGGGGTSSGTGGTGTSGGSTSGNGSPDVEVVTLDDPSPPPPATGRRKNKPPPPAATPTDTTTTTQKRKKPPPPSSRRSAAEVASIVPVGPSWWRADADADAMANSDVGGNAVSGIASLLRGLGMPQRSQRRRLLDVAAANSSLTSIYPINAVSGPFGIFFAPPATPSVQPGTISVVTEPRSDINNAELAAGAYVQFLQGQKPKEFDLDVVSLTIAKARASIPRGTPGSDGFYTLVDALFALGGSLPEIKPSPPPPPPTQRSSPPRSPPPPSPQPPKSSGTPSGGNNTGVGSGPWSFLGCYIDNVGMRALPWRLSVSDKAISIERCAGLALKNSLGYFGMQGSVCFGGNNGTQATMYGAVAAAQCNMACAGDRSQMCGFVSAARQLLSLYQVSLVINIGGNRALRAGH